MRGSLFWTGSWIGGRIAVGEARHSRSDIAWDRCRQFRGTSRPSIGRAVISPRVDRRLERGGNLLRGIDRRRGSAVHPRSRRRCRRSARSALRRSRAASSTRSSACLRSVEDRSTPLASVAELGRSPVSQWPRLEVAALATPSISWPTDGEAVLHARDDALDLPCAFTGALGASEASPLSPIRLSDLAVEIAHGIADLLRGLASRLGRGSSLRWRPRQSRGRRRRRAPPRWSHSAPAGWSASRSPRSNRKPFATCDRARAPTAPSRASMRPTASISSAMCLTAVSTALRD